MKFRSLLRRHHGRRPAGFQINGFKVKDLSDQKPRENIGFRVWRAVKAASRIIPSAHPSTADDRRISPALGRWITDCNS